MSRRALAASVALTLLLTAGGCTSGKKSPPKGGTTPPGGSPAPPPEPQANFTAGEVTAVDVLDRGEANERAIQEAGNVVKLLNAYYDIAFVKPTKWGGGQHPELAGLFTTEAQAGLAPNLGALALTDLAPKIERMEPQVQDSGRITVQVEEDLSVPIAIVGVAFEGTATTVAKEDGPLKVLHNATFWLAKEGEGFKIAAYVADLKADTGAQTGEAPVRMARSARWGA